MSWRRDREGRRYFNPKNTYLMVKSFRIYELVANIIRIIFSLYFIERHGLPSPLCCLLEYAPPSISFTISPFLLAIWPFLSHLFLYFSHNAFKWGYSQILSFPISSRCGNLNPSTMPGTRKMPHLVQK